MLKNVPHVGAPAEALEKATRPPLRAAVPPEGGDGLHQALGETGQLVRREALIFAYIGDYFEHRSVVPDVRADKHLDLFDVDIVHYAPSSTFPSSHKWIQSVTI